MPLLVTPVRRPPEFLRTFLGYGAEFKPQLKAAEHYGSLQDLIAGSAQLNVAPALQEGAHHVLLQ